MANRSGRYFFTAGVPKRSQLIEFSARFHFRCCAILSCRDLAKQHSIPLSELTTQLYHASTYKRAIVFGNKRVLAALLLRTTMLKCGNRHGISPDHGES